MKIAALQWLLAYEGCLILGVGVWLRRNEKLHAQASREGDFSLGGRNLSVAMVAATMALTHLGTAHIFGVFEMSWYMGATAVWFSLAHVAMIICVCVTTGIWMRRMRVTTGAEFLELLYGPGVRLAAACVIAGNIFGILTLEAQGVGVVLATMTGWDIRYGVFGGGALGILFVIMAGMEELGRISLINAVMLYATVVAATVVLGASLPGGNFNSIAAHYVNVGKSPFLSIFGSEELMWKFALATLVALVLSSPLNQGVLQPLLSARDEKTIQRSMWIAAPINGLFGVFIVVIGLTASALPEFNSYGPKSAAPTMLVHLLPTWLVVLLLASFLNAILSTFAMTALGAATIFSQDIYKRFLHHDATESDVRRVTRVAIVIVAVMGMSIANFLPPILAAMNWLFAWLIPLFVLVVVGLFWKRSALAATLTLSVAWIGNLAWSLTDVPKWFHLDQVPNAYVVLIISLVTNIAANWALEGQPPFRMRDANPSSAQMNA